MRYHIGMVEIDGSRGEGGGQVLRTALSLGCLLKKPFRIYNIRRGRPKPGLMPQHITSVRAAASISGASVSGDVRGSSDLVFEPRDVRPGDYFFDIGTAGSTSLVAQTLLLPLLFCDGPSSLTVKGGTHVPFSPTFHYLSEVFLPILRRLGIEVSSSINSYGFYPKGGGEVSFRIRPCRRLNGCEFTERGDLVGIRGLSAVANLPLSIAQRQRDASLKGLEGVEADIRTEDVESIGPGTFVFLRADYGGAICGFSSLGARGKRAEAVGAEAAGEFMEHDRSGACLDAHMADQIAPYLALAEGVSSFTTPRITPHLMTNLHVIENFIDVRYEIETPPKVSIEGLRR
jgi:RNA 3'-terminal phosphate cyclase (ATP)